MNKQVLVVIPAYNPGEELLPYVEELISKGFSSLLVIDDGSKNNFLPLFEKISSKPEVEIIRHSINLGKGRALKNAINYFLNLSDQKNWSGMITVDSDGQHLVKDVEKLSDELTKGSNNLILGVRDFDEELVPFKSRFGNKLTKVIFKLLYGTAVRDTQTGLRGIPKSIVHHYIDLDGERFNYETNVLVETVKEKIDFTQITIDTVYIENNSESHFRPIADSIEIYALLFKNFIKYISSSAASFLIDILIFQLVIYLVGPLAAALRIILATVIARVVSSTVNYKVNKNLVFESSKDDSYSMWRYYTLVVAQLSISALLVYFIYSATGYRESMIKIIVDIVLFFISYRIQRKYIF